MENMEFDHRVEIRDPRTGAVIQHQPYVLHIGPGKREYERPPGSGVFFNAKGEMIRDEGKERRDVAAAKAKAETDAASAAQKEQVEKERQEMLAGAKADADVLRRQLLEQAQAEADQILAEAKAKAEVESSKKGK